jgi:hypothetical protein
MFACIELMFACCTAPVMQALPNRSTVETLVMREEDQSYQVQLQLGEVDIASIEVEVEAHAITVAFRNYADLSGRTNRRLVYLDSPVERNRTTVSVSAGQVLITAAKAARRTGEPWREQVTFNTRASVGSV